MSPRADLFVSTLCKARSFTCWGPLRPIFSASANCICSKSLSLKLPELKTLPCAADEGLQDICDIAWANVPCLRVGLAKLPAKFVPPLGFRYATLFLPAGLFIGLLLDGAGCCCIEYDLAPLHPVWRAASRVILGSNSQVSTPCLAYGLNGLCYLWTGAIPCPLLSWYYLGTSLWFILLYRFGCAGCMTGWFWMGLGWLYPWPCGAFCHPCPIPFLYCSGCYWGTAFWLMFPGPIPFPYCTGCCWGTAFWLMIFPWFGCASCPPA